MPKEYKLTQTEDGLAVREYGKQDTMSIDDYLALEEKDNPSITDLLADYLSEHPDYADKLIFEQKQDGSAWEWYITDGDIQFEKIGLKSDMQTLINGEDKFLDIVDYKDILRNTQALNPSEEPDEETEDAVAKLSEGLAELKQQGFRHFINKHKILASVIAIALTVLSLTVGAILSNSSGDTGYEDKSYTDGTIDRKLKGMEASLKEFPIKHKQDPQLAILDIEEILWFEKQTDQDKMTEVQKKKLESLVVRAGELKRKHRK